MMGKVNEVSLVAVFLLPFFHNTVEANLLLHNGSTDLPTRQNGITYVSWRNGRYSSLSADRSLRNLAETGADWISLLVTGYQDDVGSTDIVITLEKTPTDEDLVHVIEEAHALGLKVMLKPHVDLFDDPDHWRGQIGGEFESEMGWEAWFSSYRDFIFHYAELAEAHGVDQFCTGTELVGTTHREGDWRRVIEGVRARFNGPLTYASNHSGEEVGIAWWDAVDYIGVDPYYPLTDKKDPTFAELKASWQGRVEMLADLSATWGKQVLFTEIGYRSVDGANRHPWEFREGGAVDLEEQADAYRAIFEGVYEQPWFAGLFWWAWGTNPFEGGSLDDGYTPHDKLAEGVIREWYGAASREIAAELEPDPDPGRMMAIYSDALGAGWEDWSRTAATDMADTREAFTGEQSIFVELEAWGALSLHVDPAMDPAAYHWLEFYIRGSAESEVGLWVFIYTEDGTEQGKRRVDDPHYMEDGIIEAGAWKRVLIPLEDLNPDKLAFTGIVLQDRTGDGTSTFWVDDIRLVGARPTAILAGDFSYLGAPGSPVLHPNYPNPFNASTEIPFDIPAGLGELEVRLELFNSRGQLVRVLVNRRVGAGHYRVLWDGGNTVGQPVASGVYLCRLRWSGFALTRSIVIIK
ncbi:MAG: hypothetical protein HOC74_34225 [Gemmatimonadetes bacterium]|jgi:hypothetical protein|nr:hypothetical protein [Gemmatimonadota bacterium]